jgi:hypothetical protein
MSRRPSCQHLFKNLLKVNGCVEGNQEKNMSQNPLNLALRFVLEILALVAIGYGGWHAGEGALRYPLALGLPLLAAFAWGSLRTPNEPHHPQHATVPVPGWVRLLFEALFFGSAAWGLFSTGATTLAWLFSAVVIAHYALSYDRVGWLIRH